MTTNIDLEKLAKKNKIKLSYIIYKDEIFKISYKPKLSIILNMSSTNHPGTHWCSLYTFKDLIVYFDSFGVVPPEEIIIWAKINNVKIVYNDYQIEQLDGTNCGQLSLLFLSLIQVNTTTSRS